MTSDTFGAVDEIFAEFVRRDHAPAVAYGVVVDGELVHTGAAGPVPGAEAIFRIASMTKSFTAAAVLLLRDRGRLELDRPVRDLVPALAGSPLTDDSPDITVRDLLTMAAGFPTDDPWADRMEPTTPEEFGELLARGVRAVRAPGTGFEYSNLGYALLGRVVGAAGGIGYRDFVRDELLRPLLLTDTGFDVDEFDDQRVVTGHRRGPDGWSPVPFSVGGEFSALGGLFSTVPDLARWMSYLADAFPPRDGVDDGPLRRATRREMQRVHHLIDVTATIGPDGPAAAATGYGLGLFLQRHVRWGDVVFHSGGYPGFGSHFRWHPSRRLGVVALANGTYAPARIPCAEALIRLLTDAPSFAPARSVWPETLAAAEAVDGLLDRFDDAVADRLFAPNMDLDQPRDERRASLAAAVAAAGATEPGARTVHTAARVSWRRTGPDGSLRIELTMSPEEPPRVQRLDVTAHPSTPSAVQERVDAVVAALAAGAPAPDGVDPVGYARVAAFGGPWTVDDTVTPGAEDAVSLRLRGPGAEWTLDVGPGEPIRFRIVPAVTDGTTP